MVFRSWVEQHFGNLDIDLEGWGKKIEVRGRVGAYGNYTKRMTLLFRIKPLNTPVSGYKTLPNFNMFCRNAHCRFTNVALKGNF